ncbi:MAG: ABC transporter permease [Clostridiales bacterium]|jgi:ABC-2 type transport system permease protein|nr:ABC transporter permease [Clostridiales bacterium]
MTTAAERPKIKSAFARELNAIVTLFMRGMVVSLKSPGTVIMSLAMPIVMMGMIGGNLSENMAGGLNYEYGPFMLVGMLVNMLFMQTATGMSSIVEDSEDNFTQEIMVAPISRYSIVIGTILSSAFIAIVSSVGTLIVGLLMGIYIGIPQLLAFFALSPLMCLAAGAFSMLLIGGIKNKTASNMAVMLTTMPQMFLSGAIIPISNSSGILFILSRCLPMTYCLDLVRAVVYAGTSEYSSVVLFNPAVTLAAIIGLTIAFLIVGTWLYARSEKNK